MTFAFLAHTTIDTNFLEIRGCFFLVSAALGPETMPQSELSKRMHTCTENAAPPLGPPFQPDGIETSEYSEVLKLLGEKLRL